VSACKSLNPKPPNGERARVKEREGGKKGEKGGRK